MSKIVNLTVDEGCLLIENSNSIIENKLFYWHKNFEKEPGRMTPNGWIAGKATIKREKILLYNVESDNPRTISTFPGFLDRVVAFIKQKGYGYNLKDRRIQLGFPQINKCKHFLRPDQLEVVKSFLSYDKSGCISMPTRYGKTRIGAAIMACYPNARCIFAAPGVDLLSQLVDDLKALLPDRDIKEMHSGVYNSVQGTDITVCSLDSLEKINPDIVDILIVDEAHASVTEGRIPYIVKFNKCRKVGLGATLEGRFDNADILIEGLFGPVVVEKTFRQAVEDGVICDIRVYMVKTPFYAFSANTRDKAYKALMFKNKSFTELVTRICNVIPEEWQTLIYIDNEKQAQELHHSVEGSYIAMQKLFKSAKKRKAFFEKMVSGNVKRCFCSGIYGQGTTFPDLRAIVNCCGGGGAISSIQKPGRLAQIREGKIRGYVIDFQFHCINEDWERMSGTNTKWKMLINESLARKNCYINKGYEVIDVDDISQLVFE